MTEEGARGWIETRYGPEKLQRLQRYVDLLLAANESQNLISKATEDAVWSRHILDSAQLERLAPEAADWLDIGSGPGLPGLVLAILTERPILLVEPRRKRVEFLTEAVQTLGLAQAQIRQAIVQKIHGGPFGAVTARAYAALPEIFSSTVRLTNRSTIWVLPKGRSAERELAEAREAWQGTFHVEHSLTDEAARIIVAKDVRPR